MNQHVEGEALVVSSEATVDQSTGEIHEKQQHPRLKLSCAKPSKNVNFFEVKSYRLSLNFIQPGWMLLKKMKITQQIHL